MPESPIPRERGFWEWKHFHNPFGVSPALIAEVNQQLIGLRTFLRWTWSSGENDIRAARAVDTATHPAFQGRGIFSTLTLQLLESMKSERVEFVFNTPNRSSLAGYLKMGWKKVTRFPLWIRPIRPLRGIFSLLKGCADRNIHTDSETISALMQMSKLEPFLRSLNDRDIRYHTARTKEFLRWRYEEIPHIVYEAVYEFKDNAAAVLIYRQKIRKCFHELSLSEILLTPNSDGVKIGGELLRTLIQRSNADYMVAAAAKNTPECRLLRKSGFIPIRGIGPQVTAYPLMEKQNVLDWENWRPSLGDFELF